MARRKRTTDKVVIIESTKRNTVKLRKNKGVLKNFLNAMRARKISNEATISLSVFLVVFSPIIPISYNIDATAKADFLNYVERINETYSGAAVTALIEQHQPVYFAPWIIGILSIIGIATLTMVSINVLANIAKNDDKTYTLKYDSETLGKGTAITGVLDEVFSEYFDVLVKIQDIIGDMEKIEKILKKPITDFLKNDLAEKLKDLEKKKAQLEKERSAIHNKSVELLRQQSKIKRLEEQKGNDAEALEILEQLSLADDRVIIEHVDQFERNTQSNSKNLYSSSQ